MLGRRFGLDPPAGAEIFLSPHGQAAGAAAQPSMARAPSARSAVTRRCRHDLRLILHCRSKRSDYRAENKRRVALSSAYSVSGLLAENVNGGVAAVFSNQRQIEAEAKLLQSQVPLRFLHITCRTADLQTYKVIKFSKQTTQWVQMIEGFNNALKELGDIENWAKTIERDMATIASSLEYRLQRSSHEPQTHAH